MIFLVFCLSTFNFLSAPPDLMKGGDGLTFALSCSALGHVFICVSARRQLLLWEIRSGGGFVALNFFLFVLVGVNTNLRCTSLQYFWCDPINFISVKRQRLPDNVKSALGVRSELTERSAFKRSGEPLCHALVLKLLQCWSNWQWKLPANMQYRNCSVIINLGYNDPNT